MVVPDPTDSIEKEVQEALVKAQGNEEDASITYCNYCREHTVLINKTQVSAKCYNCKYEPKIGTCSLCNEIDLLENDFHRSTVCFKCMLTLPHEYPFPTSE